MRILAVVILLVTSLCTSSLRAQHWRWVGSVGVGFRSDKSTAGMKIGMVYNKKLVVEAGFNAHFVYAASTFYTREILSVYLFTICGL